MCQQERQVCESAHVWKHFQRAITICGISDEDCSRLQLDLRSVPMTAVDDLIFMRPTRNPAGHVEYTISAKGFAMDRKPI